ncbi:YbaN family protein [Trueperella sp. LYQ143]|uniref:YbaN family protein n=1 Tax=unclassified Trueperella TaxID=2630174 RepID=UPI003983D10C
MVGQIARAIYAALGCFFFALGFLGIFIPVLPTVPFWLLTAACFMRGSRRLYRWLMTHPRYGPYIYQYRHARAMSTRSKINALIVMWGGMALSAWLVPVLPARISLLLIAIGVSIHLLRMETLTSEKLVAARQTYHAFLASEFADEYASHDSYSST